MAYWCEDCYWCQDGGKCWNTKTERYGNYVEDKGECDEGLWEKK